MRSASDADRWATLLRADNLNGVAVPSQANIGGKTVLVTGAGGFIGSAISKALAASNPHRLLLLDHSEANLYEIDAEIAKIANDGRHATILGDVTDATHLAELFQSHRPQIIFHAAAFKHVPLMEMNPLAAAQNNALGTWELAKAAVTHGSERLVMISTDKAVNPSSMMGASKRIAELALQLCATPKTTMSAVRFGNVYGSSGSVAPLFERQIVSGGPVTVTHPEVTRYFLTLREAVELILPVASLANSNGIFIPKLGQPVKILDVAKRLMKAAGKEVQIEFIGLRPGDKLAEELSSATEAIEATAETKLWRVCGGSPARREIESALQRLAEEVQNRSLSGVMDVVRELVPEYGPSTAMTNLLSASPV